jgi:hypothetical protein
MEKDKDDVEITKGDAESLPDELLGDDDIELVVDPNKKPTEQKFYGVKLVDVGGCGGLA